MTTAQLLDQLNTSALWVPAAGTAALGLTAGAVGSFAVLRRQSLQGDAVAHAALPGVAAAFLLGGRAPLALVAGGAAAGWLAMLIVAQITKRSRVPFDSALAGVLAVFFGLGLVLFTYIQRNVRGAALTPLERYLFGQAALVGVPDLWLIGGFGLGALALLALFWKQFKVVSFDPAFATGLGVPVRTVELLLTTLTVIAVVIGLKAVGVVLMTALLIAPCVAARQWSDNLGRVVVLAGLFGALAGAGGTVASHLLSYQFPKAGSVPTGPTIVLCATALVVVSLMFGTGRGWVWTFVRPDAPASGAV
ncbi:High-affinity zinc uptake system membrane protein ZnuB [Gemmata obscuriglobus]|uniref:Zinc ABC transporter permease n=1 Tax=Gemmata obscuriglobus TaxID=114 RepID=A0A2Z3H4B6_9BACT|nr:iron chelate uptake ABC transporter family permease subunit [Gemmata obscuriglobus]AWM38436.1 zinc ABC transporter permease [Gemmata obscuriglobus]QEG28640.1 High-affinity zinc uptake system membrane protein ZnuB [Gemmata obscuriglobus]VTS06836.1 zinc abc transporter permease : ABC-3 protein OS=Sphaerobacter thermophilus (strain DSM 20745 / S 6022) GN=Sthe_3154 PE=3 SV=1: ABC-3 [Gemmata obscuriglobus UQM 2246]